MSGLDVVADFIEDPARAAEAVREDPPIGLGLAAFALGALSVFLAQAVAGRSSLFGASWAALAILCLWRVFWGLLGAAVLHLTAEVVGGRGRALPLFVLLGLSDLAWALALPGVLLCQAFLPGPRWGTAAVFMVVGFVSLSLKARSLSHNYRIGMTRAWLALSAPLLAAMAALFAFVSLAVWGAVGQLLKLLA